MVFGEGTTYYVNLESSVSVVPFFRAGVMVTLQTTRSVIPGKSELRHVKDTIQDPPLYRISFGKEIRDFIFGEKLCPIY